MQKHRQSRHEAPPFCGSCSQGVRASGCPPTHHLASALRYQLSVLIEPRRSASDSRLHPSPRPSANRMPPAAPRRLPILPRCTALLAFTVSATARLSIVESGDSTFVGCFSEPRAFWLSVRSAASSSVLSRLGCSNACKAEGAPTFGLSNSTCACGADLPDDLVRPFHSAARAATDVVCSKPSATPFASHPVKTSRVTRAETFHTSTRSTGRTSPASDPPPRAHSPRPPPRQP